VAKGKKLYIYPEQYEGQECDPLIFCTGPVPAQQVSAQQVDPHIPWLIQQTGAKKFYLPSADYIWPHTMNKKVRQVVAANGGTIVGQLHNAGFAKRGGHLVCTYFEENFLNFLPAAHTEGMYNEPGRRRPAAR